MLSGHTTPPNHPSKGDPDDDRRFHWSKRRNKCNDNTDEGCSKTEKLSSSNSTQPNNTLRQQFLHSTLCLSNTKLISPPTTLSLTESWRNEKLCDAKCKIAI